MIDSIHLKNNVGILILYVHPFNYFMFYNYLSMWYNLIGMAFLKSASHIRVSETHSQMNFHKFGDVFVAVVNAVPVGGTVAKCFVELNRQ